jgi:putative component of membrane protein insertase Oxa1/YidC/SpoIIIJ protein YidD
VRKILFAAISIVIGISALSSFASQACGQVKDDLIFILKNNPIGKQTEKEELIVTQKEVSELKLAAIGIVNLYQKFISSQDKPSCNFTLSCSRFSLSAIRKFGIFHGLLMTSDRLLRCSTIGRKYYPVDLETGLAMDYPIIAYYAGKTKNKPIFTFREDSR